LCPRPPRDFLFYFEFSFFFGKRGEARGNGPADRGRRRRIASRTISGFTFGSPRFFLYTIIECEKRFYYQIIRFLRVQSGVKIYSFRLNHLEFTFFRLSPPIPTFRLYSRAVSSASRPEVC
jgi:hypothetical protein